VAQVEADYWSTLTDRLRFVGEKPLAAVWTPSASVHLQGDVEWMRLHSLGASPDVVFVEIPTGTFMMGSPADEVGRWQHEGPQHQVNVPAFQMARTETTNVQFRDFRPEHQGQDDLPAMGVTWDEARAFCERYGWRLPTEAEWEYAARAGTQTRWPFGDDERKLGEYAWYSGNNRGQPQPVGRKAPNPWGLFDMHGNVFEWVQDCYHDNYDKAPTDGSAWETDKCSSRVARGGSFDRAPERLRSAVRATDSPEFRFGISGFRCVRVPTLP
jgi:formylglycine-generating enzyme required for sulfatase activity